MNSIRQSIGLEIIDTIKCTSFNSLKNVDIHFFIRKNFNEEQVPN